jgi:hypothetical protein
MVSLVDATPLTDPLMKSSRFNRWAAFFSGLAVGFNAVASLCSKFL